eukprot:TRINITY_DN2624_c0_g1_i3.p1 TRINITY_DN2624_c0_g1~~TRINITY_DN2624_c0_g1_i3.p1  ORF type:complete len:670 (-),score=171.83 TRINITY_DN2624_c0_g1_i3:341-2350(-)
MVGNYNPKLILGTKGEAEINYQVINSKFIVKLIRKRKKKKKRRRSQNKSWRNKNKTFLKDGRKKVPKHIQTNLVESSCNLLEIVIAKKKKKKKNSLRTRRMNLKKTKKTKKSRMRSQRFSNNNQNQTSRSQNKYHPKSSPVPRVGICELEEDEEEQDALAAIFQQQSESDVEELKQISSKKQSSTSSWNLDSSQQFWDDDWEGKLGKQEKQEEEFLQLDSEDDLEAIFNQQSESDVEELKQISSNKQSGTLGWNLDSPQQSWDDYEGKFQKQEKQDEEFLSLNLEDELEEDEEEEDELEEDEEDEEEDLEAIFKQQSKSDIEELSKKQSGTSGWNLDSSEQAWDDWEGKLEKRQKVQKKNFGLLQQQKKDLKEDLGSVFLQQTESDMQELEQMISFKRQASDWGQDSSEESWDDRGQYRQQQQDKRSFENQQDEEWNKVLEDKIQENLQVQLKQEAEDDDDEYVDNEEEYNQDEIHESLLKQKREVFQDFEDDGQSTRNYQQGERRSGGGKPGQRGSLQSYTPWKQPGRSMVDQRDLGRQGWGKRKNQVESTTFKKFEDDDEYLQLQFDNEDQDEDEDEYMDVDEGKRTGDQKWYSHEQNQFRREKKQKPSKNQQKNKKKGPRPRKQPEIKINKGWVSGGHDDEELDWGELGSDLGKYQSSESSKWFQG